MGPSVFDLRTSTTILEVGLEVPFHTPHNQHVEHMVQSFLMFSNAKNGRKRTLSVSFVIRSNLFYLQQVVLGTSMI